MRDTTTKLLVAVLLLAAGVCPARAEEQTIGKRMTHHRAINAAVWAMPLMNYGSATFYLDLAETPDGEWLNGGKNYKLVVPPKVPVRDFWAITTYDLETASYLRHLEASSIDSNMKDVKKNGDGSVDIYFGPKAPQGKESNWLPTDPKRRFFLLFRAYGPEAGILDCSFELNDIELQD